MRSSCSFDRILCFLYCYEIGTKRLLVRARSIQKRFQFQDGNETFARLNSNPTRGTPGAVACSSFNSSPRIGALAQPGSSHASPDMLATKLSCQLLTHTFHGD